MAYSIYHTRVKNSLLSVSSIEDEQQIWGKVVAENIFIICKTPIVKSVTEHTLMDFRRAKVDTRYLEDLINQIKNKPEHFIRQVGKFTTDRTGIKNMKINAIVGSPPYQIIAERTSDAPVYNYLMGVSFRMSDKATLITPARYLFDTGKTPHD